MGFAHGHIVLQFLHKFYWNIMILEVYDVAHVELESSIHQLQVQIQELKGQLKLVNV